MRKFTLRFWVLFLVSLAIILTFSVTLVTGYMVTHTKLEQNALQMHEAYAKKFADTTDLVIRSMQQNLRMQSGQIARNIDNPNKINDIFTSVASNPFFNSIVFIDRAGNIAAMYPDQGVVGKKSTFPDLPYNLQEPFITTPYRAASTGRLIIAVSEPIIGPNGEYLGCVAGTIYLEEPNILTGILADHFFQNQSHAWVTDKEGHLLYHPDKSRIGEDVSHSNISKLLKSNGSGYARVVNTKGVDMLSGYSIVPSSGWGVGSQTPMEEIDAPTLDVVKRMFSYTIPFVLIVMILSWMLTSKLVVPLQRLAVYSNSLTQGHIQDKSLQKIPTWYFESEQLKKAIQLYTDSIEKEVNQFRKEALTDELTGLANRRRIDDILHEWVGHNRPFSMILIDIDHFKKFNDEFGHQVGDKVLQKLAAVMLQETREEDLCGRYGGEEFMILLPDTDLLVAVNVVERLRIKLSKTPVHADRHITISAGVGKFPDHSNELRTLIALTDAALYQAKHEGRNNTVVA